MRVWKIPMSMAVMFAMSVGCSKNPSGTTGTGNESAENPEKRKALAELKAHIKKLRTEEIQRLYAAKGQPGGVPRTPAEERQATVRFAGEKIATENIITEYKLKQTNARIAYIEKWGPLPPDFEKSTEPDPIPFDSGEKVVSPLPEKPGAGKEETEPRIIEPQDPPKNKADPEFIKPKAKG